MVLACLEPADDPDARTALSGSSGSAAETGELVLHIRQLAVAPTARRTGIAWPTGGSRRGRGAHPRRQSGAGVGLAAAGRPEPDAVPFYVAAGYEARPDIPDFYAEGSVATGGPLPILRRTAVG